MALDQLENPLNHADTQDKGAPEAESIVRSGKRKELKSTPGPAHVLLV
jgi:hypothetical protein